MRRLLALLPSVVLVLSTAPASADFGCELHKLLPDNGGEYAHFGFSVALSGTTAIIGAWGDEDNGSAYLFDITTGQPITKLLPDDGADNDNFGYSVAISGEIAIVGAFQDDDNGSNTGSAYLFDISDSTDPMQLAKLLPDDGAAGDLYFGLSVAISGQTAIVGSNYHDDNGTDSGAAYLFDTNTGQQIAKLLANDGTDYDHFGYSVAISGATAIVGAIHDDDNGSSSGSAYLFDTTTGQQIAKLLPDDGATTDWFGWSVAINGTTAVVTAIKDDDNGSDSGSAYIFDTTTGQQIAKLLPDDGAEADWFGISVAISGTTAIVGAERDDDNGPSSGSAYLFDTVTGQQITKLLPEDGHNGEWFGSSVAISGDTAFIGAHRDGDNGTYSGSAYFFDTTTGQQIVKILRPSDAAASDLLGGSVAISGTKSIVGARGHDHNGTDSGSAYLFDTIEDYDDFVLQNAELLANDGAAGDQFGTSVAISGTTCIVGAHLDDDNGDASGSAYLFETTSGQQIAKLLPNDGAEDDRFGISVAISNTTAIVGAWLDNDNGLDSGSAYLFDISDPENATQVAKLLADDGAAGDQFGLSVAISGETAIIGAYRDDDNGPDSGSAYVFDISDPMNPMQIAKLLPDGAAAGDQFGVSVAISGTTAVVGALADDDNGTGSAFLFDTTTGEQIAELLPEDGGEDDRFGVSVAIGPTSAIVGAELDEANGSGSGSAYFFEITTGQQIGKLLPEDGEEDDRFGFSVAISGSTAIAGAYRDDDNGPHSGSAYLFDALPKPGDSDGDGGVGPVDLAILLASWGPCPEPCPLSDTCPADFDGDCLVGPFDLAVLLSAWGPCP